MNKKKQPAGTTAAGSATEKDELAKKIAENFSFLKGGKVTQVRRPTATANNKGKSSDL